MSFCRSPFDLTPLEIASGVVLGGERPRHGVPSEPAGDPIRALRAAVLPALAGRGPCIVSFSGGRDSSAILAVAAAVARSEGLPLPIPATCVFPDAPDADEARWQEDVVQHLGLEEWVRIELGEEMDAVGPVALEHLRRHGLLWPFNAHFHAPLLRLAAGGTVLTGIGGDELLGTAEWARAAAVLSRAERPRPRDALRVALALAPPSVRRAVKRRRVRGKVRFDWLTLAGNELLGRDLAAALADEPLRWSGRWPWWRRRRSTGIGLASLDLIAADCGSSIGHPLADAAFARAAARVASRNRLHDRTAVMESLFGDLLPSAVLARASKAAFDAVFWGAAARELAATALGEASELAFVDHDGLRRAWQRPVPQPHSLLLLQAVAVRRAQVAEPRLQGSCVA